MKKLSIVEANEKTKRALKAFEEAGENYKRKAKRYIYMGPVILGKPMPEPEALLNFAALMEIDEAWRKLEHAEAKLHDTYVQLTQAHYTHFVRGDNDKPEQ